MKTFRSLIIGILLISLFSGCKEDIMKNINNDGWNNERSIIDITFEHQVGVATVKRDSDNNGIVTFMLDETSADKSKLRIKELELSYGATSDLQVGDELNFDNPEKSACITVTSQTGLEQVWEIIYQPYADELEGTWQILTLSVYGGAWPEYGSTAFFLDMAYRDWNWEKDGTGPIAEYDNTLTFTLEGITEEGNTYGTVYNDAGPDNLYADFIFIDDPDNERLPIDVNHFYRKIPAGESNWVRNYRQGSITFIAPDNTVTVGSFVDAGTAELDENGQTMIILEKAFLFEYTITPEWHDNIYLDIERFVKHPKSYWIQVARID